MIYQVFSFLFSLLIVSAVYSLNFKARFTIRRSTPEFGTVGVPIKYCLTVRNETEKTQRGLTLIEDLYDPRPSFEEFARSHEPGEEDRNVIDRYFGFFRWQWLISKKKGGLVTGLPIPALPPESEVEIWNEIKPLNRGMLRFTGSTVVRPDPLGLIRSFFHFPLKQSIRILPKRYSLPPIQLPGSRKHQPGGVALAASVGDAEEFVSLRDYRPGDPLRRIHWKSWARTGKPTVKEYQEEFFVRHALILDTFIKEDYSEIFEEAVSVAASFICTIESMESLLDLMFVGAKSYCFTTGRGLSNTNKMLEILTSVKTCKDKPFMELHHSVTDHASSLSGCICVLLSWDDKRKEFISHLKGLGIPVLVLVITGDPPNKVLEGPGPMKDRLDFFHFLEVGKISEGLAKL